MSCRSTGCDATASVQSLLNGFLGQRLLCRESVGVRPKVAARELAQRFRQPTSCGEQEPVSDQKLNFAQRFRSANQFPGSKDRYQTKCHCARVGSTFASATVAGSNGRATSCGEQWSVSAQTESLLNVSVGRPKASVSFRPKVRDGSTFASADKLRRAMVDVRPAVRNCKTFPLADQFREANKCEYQTKAQSFRSTFPSADQLR